MAKELYATTRQIIGHRTLNPYFQKAMTTMTPLDRNSTLFHGWGIDSDPTKRQASLWSGSKAVMLYAKHDFRVLENTRVGSVFDQFKLHPDWKIPVVPAKNGKRELLGKYNIPFETSFLKLS